MRIQLSDLETGTSVRSPLRPVLSTPRWYGGFRCFVCRINLVTVGSGDGLDRGEPPVLLGANEDANPVEYLLHALAGCVTTTTVLHAAARGIQIERLSTELVGTIDVQGLLALDDSVPVGYEQIRIKMDIQADCSDEELNELVAFAQDHSPVCNTICRPVPVTLERAQ